MSQQSPFTPAQVDRVARIYATNKEAARILGIHESSFNRLCNRLSIPTPMARKRARRLAWAASRKV